MQILLTFNYCNFLCITSNFRATKTIILSHQKTKKGKCCAFHKIPPDDDDVIVFFLLKHGY